MRENEQLRLWRGTCKVKILERRNATYLVQALQDYGEVRKGQRFPAHQVTLHRIVNADGLEDEWKCSHTGWRRPLE